MALSAFPFFLSQIPLWNFSRFLFLLHTYHHGFC